MAGPAIREFTQLKTFPTPFATDVLFFETRDGNLPKNEKFQYGDPHPDVARWPHHKLVFVSRGERGTDQTWWYAADREHQDEYNFEFTSGSPDFKFDTVERLYVIPRDEFKEEEPAYGSAMPLVPEGRWRTGYVLFQKRQVRAQMQELDSLYVFESRVYVRRVSITKVVLDVQTGRSKDSVTVIYHRGEEVAPGVTIDQVVDDPGSPLRGLQPDGTFREIEQLSENFFAVAISRIVPEGTVNPGEGGDPGTINPPTSEVVERPVPKVDDYIVHFRAAFVEIPYGSEHPTRSGFFLTYIRPADETGQVYDYFYAKSFEDQDAYNFNLNQSDILTRSYIVPRAEYLAGDALPDLSVGDLVPAINTPDLFSRHGYTHEFVDRADKELDSHFIIITRVFQKIEKRRLVFDQDMDHYIEILEKITGKNPDPADIPSVGVGQTLDRDQSHTSFDVWTRRSLVPKDGEGSIGSPSLPIQLPTIVGDANYDFPPYLDRVLIDTIWAYAASTGAPPAFDQDFAFTFKMREPMAGPYPTRTLRFITANPEQTAAQYPLSRRAVPQRESIMVGSAFWFASTQGNQAKADIRQIEVPPSVHPEIPLTEPDGPAIGIFTERLEATPGYNEYASQGILTVGVRSLSTGIDGLYIVEITQLNAGGAYSGETFDWGQGSIGGGTGGSIILVPPVVNEVVAASDNKSAIGTATPSSVIRLYSGSGQNVTEEGRGTSDAAGNFQVAFSTQYRDPKQIYATARKNGLLSPPLGFMTNDLEPLPPEASIDINPPTPLVYLNGSGQPGATLSIALDPQKQRMEITITGNPTDDTTIKVSIGAAVLGGLSPIERSVDVLESDNPWDIATKIRNVLLSGSSGLSVHFSFNASGSTLYMEWKVAEMHDSSAFIEVEGADGVDSVAGTVVQVGRGTATLVIPSNGNFTYAFSPALTDGMTVRLTVSDAGGVSEPLELVAALDAPPTPTSVSFPANVYNRITGTALYGSRVVALFNGVQVGPAALVAVDNSFEIDLGRPFVGGELFRIHAYIDGFPARRSASMSVYAHDLHLPKLTYTETENLILGTLPADALPIVGGDITLIKVVVRPEGDVLSEEEVDIFPNREWQLSIRELFSLSDNPKAGQRYELFYRFPQADGEAAIKAFPVVPLPRPSVAWVPEHIKVFGSTPIANATGTSSSEFPEFMYPQIFQAPGGGTFTEYLPVIGWAPGLAPPSGFRYAIIDPRPNDNTITGNPPNLFYNELMFARAPWMGPGTTVDITFPGSSKPPIHIEWMTPPDVERVRFRTNGSPEVWGLPQPRPANLEEYSIIPLGILAPGGVDWMDLVPPITTIRVTAPDGRISETTLNRSTKAPFKTT